MNDNRGDDNDDNNDDDDNHNDYVCKREASQQNL